MPSAALKINDQPRPNRWLRLVMPPGSEPPERPGDSDEEDADGLLDDVHPGLRGFDQWVCWKAVGGVKTPRTVDGRRNASTADPATWSAFDVAARAVREAPPGTFDGVGVVFTADDPFVGLDFDGCLDDDGQAVEWARPWLERFAGCYVEVSPSGRGLHVYCRGKIPKGGKVWIGPGDHCGIEAYDRGRYFCVTGRLWGGFPENTIPDRQDVIDDLFAWAAGREPTRGGGAVEPADARWNRKVARGASGDPMDSYLAKVVEEEAAAVAGTAKGGRNNRLHRGACRLFELSNTEPGKLPSGEVEDRLTAAARSVGLTDSEIETTLASARRGMAGKTVDLSHVGRMKLAASSIAAASIDAQPDLDARLAAFPRTDMGNAERLVARFGGDVRYCHVWRRWLVWDGRRFAADDNGAIARLAKLAIRGMLHEAASIPEHDERKAHLAWQKSSESRQKLESAVKLAANEDGVEVGLKDLDGDGWLLNCLNGTVDLRTGNLRPHDRSDLITQLCPVEFDPAAECPLWEATLNLFFAGDQRLIGYWHRLCGYFLTGVIRDNVLPIAFGEGANGKSTILGTLQAVMGPDYAIKAHKGMLLVSDFQSIATDLADLFRKRLVLAIETGIGHCLDETLVKELTGGDVIRARRLYQDFWEFTPTHKIVLATNHKPRITGNDKGIWRRLKLVPFKVSLKPEECDTSMKDKLLNEAPGILAWCVRGALAFQEVGLNDPDTVQAATKDYAASEDVIGAFLGECTLDYANGEERSSDVYARFKGWCEKNGERPMSQKDLKDVLIRRGFRVAKKSSVYFQGFKLKPDRGPNAAFPEPSDDHDWT